MAVHFSPITVSKIEKLTMQSVAVSFTTPPGDTSFLHYKPGQHITLQANINGKEVRRSYSICTAPHLGVLTVGIKWVHQGVFSTYANTVLKVGDTINALPPAGKFGTITTDTSNQHYLAIACGSGITPILSIISHTLYTQPTATFTLVYNNRTSASIMFLQELEALKNTYISRLHVIHILSQQQSNTLLNYGRITAAKLQELALVINYNNMAQILLCGPQDMVLSTKAYFETLGINSNKIHTELFGTAKQHSVVITQDTPTEATATVTLIADGRQQYYTMPTIGTNILDAAIAVGIELPYACKAGVCCTCKAKLISGKVHMLANYALEPDEVDAGYILSCQAQPLTSEVTVDFDVK